jgi:hypothetical protein
MRFQHVPLELHTKPVRRWRFFSTKWPGGSERHLAIALRLLCAWLAIPFWDNIPSLSEVQTDGPLMDLDAGHRHRTSQRTSSTAGRSALPVSQCPKS